MATGNTSARDRDADELDAEAANTTDQFRRSQASGRARSLVLVVMAAALLIGVPALADPVSPAAETPPRADTAPRTDTALARRVVFLDPGHQGTDHLEDLSRQVPDGRGGTKNCQTSGMTSLGGTPEHTINWEVAQAVAARLKARGATVVFSRPDDTGWGGCVDDRARAASDSRADVAISIHADSTSFGVDDRRRGFHVIVPTLPIPDRAIDTVQAGPGRAASIAVRDAYLAAGFDGANYGGVEDGLQTRADIAGPALTGVPDVFLEMGNGANPDDAALLESVDGRARHADAITAGLVAFLAGR